MLVTFFNVLYPVCVLAGGINAALKIRDLVRDPRNPVLIALVAARVFPTVSFLVATPAVYTAFDRVVGRANAATIVVYGFIVLNSLAAQVLLLLWRHPARAALRRAAPRLVLFGGALGAMSVLFLLGSVPGEHPVDFDVTFARQVPVGAMLAVYQGAFAVGLGASAVMTLRFARVVPSPWLRRGLRMNAVGAGFGLGYCLGKSVSIVAVWSGSHSLDMVNIVVAPVSASAGALLIGVSSTIPAWGPRLQQHVELWRTYRGLEPLWLAAVAADPSVALARPGRLWLDRWSPRGVRFRLTRRILEIRDLQLGLREYVDPTVVERAAQWAADRGLTDAQRAAVVEAAAFRSATGNYRLHTPVGGPAPDAARLEDQDDAAEARHLLAVAAAFDEPRVRALADERGGLATAPTRADH